MAVPPGDGHTSYVASLDVGSSGVRCHLYDRQGRVCGTAFERLQTECPSAGVFEVDPEHLWQITKDTLRAALKDASVSASSVQALGISTQRATFACWDRRTGRLLHKFISWKDTRAESLCREWNSSARVKAIRMGASFLYCLTHKHRYLIASILRFESGLVVMRLLWALQNIPGLREGARKGHVVMGTVDSFLLWRLTGGRVHATEPSNACITGLFDPFTMEWSHMITNMLDIPVSMLPKVLNTSGVFGMTDPEILGTEIPIACLAGDQQASAFGECCFQAGDVKCTMGTGTFFDANTADQPLASTVGIYPVVGWKIGNGVTYLAEGGSFDTGTVVDWAQELGLIRNAEESAEVAESVDNSAGVFFIPAFSGLQAPVNDAYAAAGFLGLSPSTRPAHMVRAMLESLAFRTYQLHALLKGTSGLPAIGNVRFTGGVTRNLFLMQLLADLLQEPIICSCQHDSSALGAAYLAGLAVGFWKDLAELQSLQPKGIVFKPRVERAASSLALFNEWCRAVERFTRWHTPTGSWCSA
ncbi:glycerol kinase 5 isoform X1 [Dermacentor variabilis]|uniref:glycerol kinase 5 isoform X1 n=1 Tax=Dermacentor variabilis TaxID=34621 RepID=UPI003F5BB03F